MPKKKTSKNIISVESWNGSDVSEPRGGMRSLISFISEMHGTRFSHNFLYTPEEMAYVLKNVPTRNFSLLYFSLHGKPNTIQTGMFTEFEISLEDVASMMGKRFAGFGVHFASCAVMASNTDSIYEFIGKTGVSFVSGYSKYVDFGESSIVDLAFINRWMFSRNYNRMFENMLKSYKPLLNENGFRYFLP